MNEKAKPTHLDLFTGIGGFALAAQWAGFRTVGFCEIDPYAQRVIAKNFGAVLPNAERDGFNGSAERRETVTCDAAGRVPQSKGFRRASAPIHTDIRQLDGKQFAGVSLITGGFPCQPFSCAGKRRGTADDRHLWPEMLRVIAEARPAWVLGENVAGIINMELDTVLSQLEAIGYATRPFVIPACGVDARHRRNRVWIVGYSTSEQNHGERGDRRFVRRGVGRNGKAAQQGDGKADNNGTNRSSEDVPDTTSGIEQRGCARSNERGFQDQTLQCTRNSNYWQPESNVGVLADALPARLVRECPEPEGIPRVAQGVKDRVQKLRGLGNAIVPSVAYQILKVIRDQIG